MDNNTLKRITVFAGHYGSGKTNIAVNYALYLKKYSDKVSIADLDIVNPYFRTKDSTDILKQSGVQLISSPYANTNVDTPALPAEVYSLLHDKSVYGVIDVGGDDRGALALGRYTDGILTENNYEFLFVISKYRPLTRNALSTLSVMKEIENACRMKFTGIVNNSNLGEITTAEDVLESLSYADEISCKSGIPIFMTTVKSDLYSSLSDKIPSLFPINIYVEQSWEKSNG